MRLMAVTDFGTVEIHDDELRELTAKLLAQVAADAAREASSEHTGKKRGRPPGAKNRPAAAQGEDNGVVEIPAPVQS